MINIVDVTHHYGIRPVLRKVNLQVDTGQLVAVMGPNGMGKSTLLGVAAGVLWPLKGYVEINGLRRRTSADDELAIRKQVVYLPDHPWLPKNSTGREFLVAVGRLYEIDDDRLMDHVDRLLGLFDLSKHGDSPIRSYSSGQQKKIAICSALITEAPVMLLDEPFAGGLDPSAILALKRVLQRLAERSDVTVLMATPVPEIVEGLAHKVVVIRDGEVIAYETPEGLRRITGCSGSLQEVLERLIHPQTLENIEKYFEEISA
ncbi:MAG: ABC transporter ATP-binding protein [Planctomycetota bacterium]|nr:MAG: ABC transporter ATP-binding protein [Planctomycetota bacterium]